MSLKLKKQLYTLQNHWVVKIRLHILAIHLLRTTASFIRDHHVFFFLIRKLSTWTTKLESGAFTSSWW